MIWNPLTLLMGAAQSPAHANQLAARWQRAANEDRRLVEDVIAMGRIMETPPVELRDGVALRAPVDPNQLLIEQGRREMALEILALMNVDRANLAQMMRDME